jgi:mitochondrial inner membrane protease ATP23
MQVILNAPHITNQNVASRTMVHESIHAFDHCRVKLDIGSCKHLACSEIRAANLSTDCNFSEETNRGIYKLQGQQKVWCCCDRVESGFGDEPTAAVGRSV